MREYIKSKFWFKYNDLQEGEDKSYDKWCRQNKKLIRRSQRRIDKLNLSKNKEIL